MTGLISEAQMAAIRRVAEKGMVTTVEIFRRGPADQAAPQYDYGDDVEYTETAPSRRGMVQGWLRTVASQEQDVDSGAIVTTNAYDLRVPVGTDIQAGDEVLVSGTDEYTVQGTNADNTLLPYISCELRRRE